MDLVKLIEVNAYGMYVNCLVGNPAPRVAKLLERITNPQIGDLVLELTTLHLADRDGLRLGRLLRHEKEFVPFPEEEGGYYEECWYIETLSGQEYRWHNANFIVVIESTRMLRTFEGAIA